jgi:DNA polymerase elongation subunit (family B)
MSKFYTNIETRGNYVLYRGYDKGIPVQEKIPYRPHLFVKSQEQDAKYHVFKSNVPVKKREFDSIESMKTFVEDHKDLHGFDIYGCKDITRQFTGNTFKGDIDWDYYITKIWFFDIETRVGENSTGFPSPDHALEEILLITMMEHNTKRMVVWSQKPISKDNKIYTDIPNVEVRVFETEKLMLKDFLMFFATERIDIISGWNSETFDIPYIVNRIKNVLGEAAVKFLSPWRVVKPRTIQMEDDVKHTYDILGITHLDSLDIYKKFNPGSKESFKLDFIADYELGERKVELPGDSFKDSYTNHWETFVFYNAIDTMLLHKLELKMLHVRLAMQLGFIAKCQFDDVLSAMRLWESIIYNYFLDNDIVEELDKERNEKHKIVGAYVHDPVPGKYGWTVSIDATSLYPSIMMQNNISPECVVDMLDFNIQDILDGKHIGHVPEGHILSANGLLTRTDIKGFIPILVERMFNLRKETKNKMLELKRLHAPEDQYRALDIAQQAYKTAANSFFGVTGLSHFKYYDFRLAEAITSTGQVFIKRTADIMNVMLSKVSTGDSVIYMDTDSVVGDTLVYVNDQLMRISDLYDSITTDCVHEDVNTRNFVKPVDNILTKSFNTTTERIEQKQIKYVMKHRVTKRMYEITVGGKSVIVTEDHSVIVKRGTEYLSASPANMLNDDVVISIDMQLIPRTSTYTIVDLGIQEIDVYDIEVDDNHNFFANDILVHNSQYFTVQSFVDTQCKGLDQHQIVNKLEKFVVDVLSPPLNKKLTTFANTLGVDKCKIFFKLECIGPSIIFVAKKRYAFDILYTEGVRYEEPKMKVMGIEIVRSSTPSVVKDFLKDSLKLCLSSTEVELQRKVKDIKKSFFACDYTEVSFPRGVNGMTTYSNSASIYVKGCPIHVRGSLLYNHTVKRLGLDNKYQLINDGDKVKFVALKMPNTIHENVIAYVNKLPDEFNLHQYIDYKTQFEKAFLKPLNGILESIGWDAEEKVTLDFD